MSITDRNEIENFNKHY